MLVNFLKFSFKIISGDGMSKFSIIIFSGTADKLIPLGILSQAAAAMGYDVNVFVTGWALLSFTNNPKPAPFPKEFENMAGPLMEGMQKANMPSWMDMLKQAKQMGAKVYACSAMCTVMGLEKKDLNDIVDDIVGAASFLQMSEGGQVIFI